MKIYSLILPKLFEKYPFVIYSKISERLSKQKNSKKDLSYFLFKV